jgi:hypothetical protein
MTQCYIYKTTMHKLPEDIQNTIFKYKHQLEFKDVMDEFVNKTVIKARIGHKSYIADHIRINGIHRVIHNYLWGLGSDLPWRVRTLGGSRP